MRCVVTGAAGFIGRHLVSRLARAGHEVVAADIRPVTDWDGLENVRYQACDVRIREQVRPAVEGADVVYHLAAAHLEVNRPPSFFEEVNVGGALTVLQEACEAGVKRIVHTSSVGAMGDTGAAPADETFPCRPQGVYGRTKLEGERTVLAEAERLGAHLSVVRPAWVYGPGCRRTEKLLRAVKKRRFVLAGGGRNFRHPVFIDDFLDGIELAALRGAPGAVYIIAGPRPVTVRELAAEAARVQGVPPPRLSVPLTIMWCGALGVEWIARILQREPPLSRRTLEFFRTQNAYSIERARSELGYEPRVELAEGLKRTLAAMRNPSPAVPQAA